MADNGVHPFHPHKLSLYDPASVYGNLTSKWKCDVCREPQNEDCDDGAKRQVYHCFECKYFDMCHRCFRGYFHPFHTHRLKPADPQLCYPHTKGLWRCDACQQIHSLLSPGSSNKPNNSMYHCSRCQIDLCGSCYRGECRHVSHGNGTHPLIPIDPRIYYRKYKNWICSVCGREGCHDDNQSVHFHCKQCDEDICNRCYKGYRHHLHQHNIVPFQGAESDDKMAAPQLVISCSECNQQVTNDNYHLCSRPSCSYYMCDKCFNREPKPHPLHPDHTLTVTDPAHIYPEVEGKWICDNCKGNYGNASKMHHCEECGYDLCHACYKTDKYTPLRAMSPVTNNYESPPTSPKYGMSSYVSSKDRYQRPVLAKTSMSYIPSTSGGVTPISTLCAICGLSSAKATPIHRGVAHATPLYCQPCGEMVLKERRHCTLCGHVPDGMMNC